MPPPPPSLIPFNKPYLSGDELKYIQEAIALGKISGNGAFTQKCQAFFEARYQIPKCLLTNSCTAALEMAAILFDIQPGDEVILPSFTFVSTATAFVRRGAKLRFVDSRVDHPGMDESKIEELINPKTKAIIAVHYAGVPCDMDVIMELASYHDLWVVEDAAQAIESNYKGRQLGTIGHLGAMSFHETKNIQCGEGGMLMINDPYFANRAEVIWEKGTNRMAFSRGEIDKYTWLDEGSSFLCSDLSAAFLWAQLEKLDEIQRRREAIWKDYHAFFSVADTKPKLLSKSFLDCFINEKLGITPSFFVPPSHLMANAHIFYLLFPDIASRMAYIDYLKECGIMAVFHYQSLHKSAYSKEHFPEEYARKLPNSDRYSDCLLRLPMFVELGGD